MRKIFVIIATAAVLGVVMSCSKNSQEAEQAVKEFEMFVHDVEKQTSINRSMIDKILADNAIWEKKYGGLPESAFTPEQKAKLEELIRRYSNKMMMLSAIQLDEVAEQMDTATTETEHETVRERKD